MNNNPRTLLPTFSASPASVVGTQIGPFRHRPILQDGEVLRAVPHGRRAQRREVRPGKPLENRPKENCISRHYQTKQVTQSNH